MSDRTYKETAAWWHYYAKHGEPPYEHCPTCHSNIWRAVGQTARSFADGTDENGDPIGWTSIHQDYQCKRCGFKYARIKPDEQ